MDLKVNGFAMAGGDDIQSYTKNSSYQRAVMDAAKLLVQNSIADHINDPPLATFRVADLGCSVGPNTFIAVDNILDSVKLKYRRKTDKIPEFQVYFNDHILNDFNTLFKSLPPNRDYYSSAVPGSFYTRLFPRGSLHVIHSSTSLHWLSQVPIEITDPNSPAYNKGRIHYAGAGPEVVDAYARQHATDFSRFLQARAEELVAGGLLMLYIPARPNGVPHSDEPFVTMNDRMGTCLMDLAKKGVIDENKVDTFNLPEYFATPDEFEEIIKSNGRFVIERMEKLPTANASYNPVSAADVSRGVRAVMAGLVGGHFGHEILDDVFSLFEQKQIEANDHKPGSELNLFILLKLNQDIAAAM
ncbi:hypothetical protein CASFOL_017271 [Castilleja foliolosa]|uniref:S-adenosylmethionine-dependent methyltransferase n=1 Tax=Castilleja foliolosa TaxID=1961234 RepID=A0ABD3DDX6_9LAMI